MSFLKIISVIAKLILGITYAVAGLLKAIGINNTRLKIEEYLTSFGLDELNYISLFLAFLLVGTELFVGLSLLFDLNKRVIAKVTFLLTILMLVITAYIYIYNPINDCGCFGSVLILDNNKTFYKNILLFILAAIYCKTYSRSSFLVYTSKSMLVLTLYIFVCINCFMFYNYKYAPILDISKYRVGYNFNNPNNENHHLKYLFRNHNGVEYIFSNEDAPWDDFSWSFIKIVGRNNYDFSDLRLNKLVFNADSTEIAEIKDATNNLYHGMLMLIVVDNLFEINRENAPAYSVFLHNIKDLSCNVCYVTCEISDSILYALNNIPYKFDICQIDNTVIKSILNNEKIQFILLKDGVIINKWNQDNIPDNIDSNNINSLLEKSSFYYLANGLLISILALFPFLIFIVFKKNL